MRHKRITIDGIQHKQCTSIHGCGEWLPVDEFRMYIRKEKMKSGEVKKYECLKEMCRECEKAHKREKNKKFRDRRSSFAYHTAHHITPDWKPVFAS